MAVQIMNLIFEKYNSKSNKDTQANLQFTLCALLIGVKWVMTKTGLELQACCKGQFSIVCNNKICKSIPS